MGYTLSFDASEKCQGKDVKGYLHHTCRDVDKEQGKEVRHSNPDIDPARTKDNQTVFYNQQTGRFEQCQDISQVEQSIADRLRAVTKPLRKDAVVLRPLILQLDPKWYEGQTTQEKQRATEAMTDWAIKTFGAENLVVMSLHDDETNPHLHIGFCPVTKDGRLSQKDWFSSPKKLREMHQDFRQHMKDQGFDIEMSNKKPGKHAKRLKDGEYKDFSELEKQRQELEQREKALKERERETATKSLQNKITAKRLSEALEQAQTLLDDIRDQQTREALQGRLQALQRPLPSNAPTVTTQAPDRQYQ